MMKQIIVLFAIAVALQACAPKVNYTEVVIPANKGYAEPWTGKWREMGVRFNQDAEQEDVRNWTSSERTISWYINISEGDYKVNLNMMVDKDATSEFEFSISAADAGGSFAPKHEKVKIKGTGEFVKTFLTDVKIEKAAFYRLELKPVSKTAETFATLRNLIFDTPEGSGDTARFAKWLTTPSVHLSYKPEDEKKYEYDWLYSEILVPQGFDPMYSFYMSIGYYRGYFGIQVNSADERRVLFSVWDSSNEAIDREKVKADDRVVLIDKGDNTQANDFGHEGTGGQSFIRYNWKTGTPVKFIMNARRLSGKYMMYSAWFMDNEAEGWKYVATWRAPREERYFDGFYSFVENYGPGSGQAVRKANYYNCWGHKADTKEWIEFNKAKLTHTDGTPEGRSDYEGGVAPDNKHAFYMASGGYTEPIDPKATIVVEKTNTPPKVDVTVLSTQIETAYKKWEKTKK